LGQQLSANLQMRLFAKKEHWALHLAYVTLVKPKIFREEIAQLSHHTMIIENFRSSDVIFGSEIVTAARIEVLPDLGVWTKISLSGRMIAPRSWSRRLR
jgi:hypothetical protein